jgi:hypothetical protein
MQLEKAPETVFVCNTGLHIMNAMDACVCWGIQPEQAWVVIKTVPTATPESITPVLELANWAKVIWIGDFPVEGRGLFSFWRFHVRQFRFYRKWQNELLPAKNIARVFLSLNRMGANRIIANWLCPREIIWLDDGTLTYALALDSVLPPIKSRAMVRKDVVKTAAISGKKGIAVTRKKKKNSGMGFV